MSREDSDITARVAYQLRAEEEIRKAVLLAVAVLLADGGRADVRVEWSSLNSLMLNGTEGYGRCAVCNGWAYDAELADGRQRNGVSRGAVVGGKLRCDEHLPEGHPLSFGSRGYDGPLPPN